jgi:DNA-directed RNA polymerase sigma subunit (sigma70/sigma32)
MSIMGEELARELHFAALANGLEKLTPKQRFVIQRSWGLGGCGPFSFREIADVMGISFQAVHGIYSRAMRELGECSGVDSFTQG